MTLRRFLRWSEDQATAAGLTPAQHQLLVAIKGHPGPEPPAIRDIAEYLQLQSHSAVGLVDRAEAAGVVRRQQDARDARVVRLYLTSKGDRLVKNLTSAHLRELYNLSEALNNVLQSARPEQMHSAELAAAARPRLPAPVPGPGPAQSRQLGRSSLIRRLTAGCRLGRTENFRVRSGPGRGR